MARVEVQTTVLDDPDDTFDDATFDVDEGGYLRVHTSPGNRVNGAELELAAIYAPTAWIRARTIEEST